MHYVNNYLLLFTYPLLYAHNYSDGTTNLQLVGQPQMFIQKQHIIQIHHWLVRKSLKVLVVSKDT